MNQRIDAVELRGIEFAGKRVPGDVAIVRVPQDFSRRLARGERPQLLVEADATDPVATVNAIAALNKAKTTIEWAKRKGRVEDASLDQETRDRLRRELEQLEARRQQLMKEAP